MFWLGRTARPDIHPIVPMLSGVLFGTGSLTIFMAMLIYLTDVYKTRSASANAAASTLRSIFAVCLPFAGRPMYRSLGVQWASSLLAFVALVMGLVPFWFLKSGGNIRRRSRFATDSEQISTPENLPTCQVHVVGEQSHETGIQQKPTAENGTVVSTTCTVQADEVSAPTHSMCHTCDVGKSHPLQN